MEKFDQNDFEFKDMNHIDRAMVVDRDGKVNLFIPRLFLCGPNPIVKMRKKFHPRDFNKYFPQCGSPLNRKKEKRTMKNLLRVGMGLLFISATGMLRADDAALQTDKNQEQHKVDVDQHNLNTSNDKLNADQSAINGHNDTISGDKKEIKKDSVSLKKQRARRARRLAALKKERDKNRKMTKSLDDSKQNLKQTDEKIEDKKQDAAAK